MNINETAIWYFLLFWSIYSHLMHGCRVTVWLVHYNTNSSSALSLAIEGSSGRILAILGFVAQKCPLFPLLFCPKYTVQLFFSAFLSHAAV